MKNSIVVTRKLSVLASGLAAALTLFASGTVNLSASDSTLIVPVDSRAYGRTYEQWAAAWWEWALELPVADFDVRAGQKGNVWFLGGPIGTTVRSATIPAGKSLFIGLLNAEASNLEAPPFHGDTEAEQREAAIDAVNHVVNLSCTIDGAPVQNVPDYRVVSPQIHFFAPSPWLFGDVGGEGTSVGDGYYILVKPLGQGVHTIHFAGSFHFTLAEDGFDGDFPVDMTYIVTVK